MREPRRPRDSRLLLHPAILLCSALGVVDIGFWLLVGGEAVFGAFVLLLGLVEIVVTGACAPIWRRIQGDPRPLYEQRVFRFQGLFVGIAALAFLALALWSRATGADVFFEVLGFALATFLGSMAILFFVVRVLVSRARRRAD